MIVYVRYYSDYKLWCCIIMIVVILDMVVITITMIIMMIIIINTKLTNSKEEMHQGMPERMSTPHLHVFV